MPCVAAATGNQFHLRFPGYQLTWNAILPSHFLWSSAGSSTSFGLMWLEIWKILGFGEVCGCVGLKRCHFQKVFRSGRFLVVWTKYEVLIWKSIEWLMLLCLLSHVKSKRLHGHLVTASLQIWKSSWIKKTILTWTLICNWKQRQSSSPLSKELTYNFTFFFGVFNHSYLNSCLGHINGQTVFENMGQDPGLGIGDLTLVRGLDKWSCDVPAKPFFYDSSSSHGSKLSLFFSRHLKWVV